MHTEFQRAHERSAHSGGYNKCNRLCVLRHIDAQNGRSEKNTVLYIILSVLSGSISPIMITAAWLALPYDPDRERSRRKARNGLIIAFFVVLVTYAAVYIALGQETAQNIGLSELYIKVMLALFVAVIAVFAFIPSSKYKRRDSAEK